MCGWLLDYELKLNNYTNAVKILGNRHGGTDHPELAALLIFPGEANRERGMWQRTWDFKQRALEMRKRLFQQDHPKAAFAVGHTGNHHAHTDRYAEAL